MAIPMDPRSPWLKGWRAQQRRWQQRHLARVLVFIFLVALISFSLLFLSQENWEQGVVSTTTTEQEADIVLQLIGYDEDGGILNDPEYLEYMATLPEDE